MDILRRFSSKPAAIKYYGLQNQGATCYLNAVLQVLFMTKDFREAVRRYGRNDDSFQTDLKNLFEELKKGETYTWSITKGLGISSGSRQGDAAECFEKIMNSLKIEEASQMFKIWLTHKNVCAGCETERSTDEQFWHLPLELVEESYRAFKVVDGIDRFFSESMVIGEDQLYCETCGHKMDSHDKFEMKDHPEVLTLLLKRFEFDHFWNRYVKIQRRAEIPYTITIQGQKYELYAFVEHCGDLKVGHYVVTIKSEDNKKWYNFNDTFVKLLSYQPFQLDPSYGSWDAYLLFYRREKKTSSQDEASCPAAVKPENCVINDPSGNAVTTEEKEDEETTADRKNVTGSEGKGSVVDEEREEKTLIQEKVVPENKGRITSVDERMTPTDVEEEATSRKATDDREPAGGHEKLQTKYDLVNSPHINTTSETKHEERNREVQQEEAQRKNSFYKEVEVQDSAAVNCDRHNVCSVKDEASGQDYGLEDQVKRGDEETHSHKPNDGMMYRSYREHRFKCSSSEHPLANEIEERRQIKRDDERAQTRENSQRHSSQTVERQNQRRSNGVSQTRPQDDLKEETRPRDVKRHIEEKEEMRANQQSKHQKGETGVKVRAGGKCGFKAADVESVSERLSNMKLRDSTSVERSDKGTQTMHINVCFPSTLDNAGDFDRQSQHWVQNLVCGNCLSVAGTILTDINSHKQIFIPLSYLEFAENNVYSPWVPVHTTGPPSTPPYRQVNEEAGQHEAEHQNSYISGGGVLSTAYHYLPCMKRTDHSSDSK